MRSKQTCLKNPLSIRQDTPILPAVISLWVVDELEQFLQTEEFDAARDYLVDRAETIYLRNECWRKKILSAKGRDLLWAFMRHWLCGWVKDNHPRYYSAIPQNYLVGGDLPDKQPTKAETLVNVA